MLCLSTISVSQSVYCIVNKTFVEEIIFPSGVSALGLSNDFLWGFLCTSGELF
jgi:phosphoheptose isomerase